MKSENRRRFGKKRDIPKELEIEKYISRRLCSSFKFRFIIVNDAEDRKGLEKRCIGTVAYCSSCKPSINWLGRDSPIRAIRDSGLWQSQHVKSEEINDHDKKIIEKAVEETLRWLSGRFYKKTSLVIF
jgi:hypothetical protein